MALVGETVDQVREVMIFGDSGILACSPPDRRPEWEATRKRLVWPNGAMAQVFSAHDPEGLRGPQFDAAWVDELAKWKKARGRPGTCCSSGCGWARRRGRCVTTTPRNVGVLKTILEQPVDGGDPCADRGEPGLSGAVFLDEVRARYAGTRLGRQELDGVLLEDAEGALWTASVLEACRVQDVPELDRIVVAVDPPVTGHAGSDECGIVVVGAVTQGPPQDWRAVVLEDASVSAASPLAWAEAAIAAMERHGAERLVAEVNQGGDLVESGAAAGRSAGAVPQGACVARQGGAGRAGGGAV